ncbi:unnamed protein product [Heligmosomoides polygyrus]|uniref:Tetratricopeptide repeat protein n=1 Tax=Heligmosomoides polygyrus TaxID=6339 RepID=A0A183FEE8_HELPZ|nr:unnamed protein product [Heligmosomoides polygyrus]
MSWMTSVVTFATLHHDYSRAHTLGGALVSTRRAYGRAHEPRRTINVFPRAPGSLQFRRRTERSVRSPLLYSIVSAVSTPPGLQPDQPRRTPGRQGQDAQRRQSEVTADADRATALVSAGSRVGARKDLQLALGADP